MPRPLTLFTGQWADLPLEEVCRKAVEFGYDGLELACWGDHFDVFEGAKSKVYCDAKHATLAKYGLKTWAISNHLAGQLVCDPNNDSRSDGFASPEAAGDAEKKRQFGIDSMKAAAKAARNMGIKVVPGFTGSPIWHLLYSFPPNNWEEVEAGYQRFAALFGPILDEFKANGVKFALEVHPTEIAYDIPTTRKALAAVEYHEAFGFNFDPSHLQWQGIDPVRFLDEFGDRVFHVHMKDCVVLLNGSNGILGSHLNFGEEGRGWEFCSVGRGDVDFDAIVRKLNKIGYQGPLSVEWEDPNMDREFGARDACDFLKTLNYPVPAGMFDEAFTKKK
ncbi:sugar phosphate isomerase/epimerase [candidate division KSB1 bacterium]|nr:sugar phosphate isomerase/epimerase [candidate division KSB1 bacterium]